MNKEEKPSTEYPLVSIFCLCKNSAQTMRRHLDAVLAVMQQYENIEYIVQDGESTDGTLGILQEYAPKFQGRMKFVSKKDKSIGEAYLRALKRCTGAIVCASLSDEELLPDAIARAVGHFRNHPEADVIYGDIYNTDIDGNIDCRNPARPFDLETYICHALPLHFAASFYRTDALKKVVFTYPWDWIVDDFVVWVRLGLFATMIYVPEVFAKYTIREDQISERPETMVKLVASRAEFIESFVVGTEAPEEIRRRGKSILGRFYLWAETWMRRRNRVKEAAVYAGRIAELRGEVEGPAAGLAEASPSELDSTALSAARPLLSVVYPGCVSPSDNSSWRLSTVLNKQVENLVTLGLEKEVEVLVCDWGNEPPLHTVLELTEHARRCVRFVLVSREVASTFDGGGEAFFPPALNAATRRARGKFLMICHQDLFVPLETMTRLVYFLRVGYLHSFDLRNSFFWASPYRVQSDYVASAPYREHLEEHLRSHWENFSYSAIDPENFDGEAACLLVNREIWEECAGLDERLSGNRCRVDITDRLVSKYRWDSLENHGLLFVELLRSVDSGEKHECLRHDPAQKVRPIAVNSPNWGLAGRNLRIVDGFGLPVGSEPGTEPFQQPATIREIVSSDPRYADVARRFPFEPHGFFSNKEPIDLLLTALQPRRVCEIGSWMGASARCLAAPSSVDQVVCIDHWDCYRVEKFKPGAHPEHLMNNMYEQFLANAVHVGLDQKIVPMRMDSHAAVSFCLNAGLRFDLIYVDGDHTTVGAKADIISFSGLLSEGGYLCGDDWSWQTEPNNVAGAVISAAREKGWGVFFHGNFWLVIPGIFAVQPLTLETFNRVRPITVAPESGRRPGVHAAGSLPNEEVEITPEAQAITKQTQGRSGGHDLPVHFFTIVLNGEPFIRHHIEVFRQLPFKWHWHVIEGVAALTHDTGWSVGRGGRIPESMHRMGRSVDGTSEYLESLAAAFPEYVTVCRKPLGQFWDGKLEMVNAPLSVVPEGALLWQVDADELWTVEQILRMREMFQAEPNRKAAYFWCHFFMAPGWLVSTRGTYGNHREYEWLRVHRFELGARWSTHEPPVLTDRFGKPLAEYQPFLHRETERAGLVFQHMAYALESQVQFKESYYGYTGAVAAWKIFQSGDTATMLALHFPWVSDHARAQRIETLDVHPLASQGTEGEWSFESHGLSPCQEQILYIRTDAIGDAILSNSILPHLRERWPQAIITVLCQDRTAELYRACPHVNEVLPFNRARAVSDDAYRNGLLAQVRSIGADRTLCPVFSREVLTDLLVGASQAPVRIGMEGDLSNQNAEDKIKTDRLYTRLIPSREGTASELDHHQDFLNGLGIDSGELEPTLWTTAQDEAHVIHFFNQHGLSEAPVLAFFPGAQHQARVYDRYRPVLENLAAEGWRILAFGSESEIALCDGFISGIPGAINLAGQLGLGKVAAMFRRCTLGLGAESGLAHMCNAVDLPNVIVLGGGHFGRFCPSSPKTTAVVLPLDCYFCNWQCRFEHPHCVKDLIPEVLMRAVGLARQPSERPRVVAQSRLLSRKRNLPSVIDLGPLLNSGNVEYHLVPVEDFGIELVPEEHEEESQGATIAAPRTTVICAVWHKDEARFELLKAHQACLDAQVVAVERVYVFDGGDHPPAWLKGRCISLNEPLGLYEAWNAALPLVRTPYVMNLNLDDRLNPEAVAVFEQVLDDGADLVGGDWLICFDQAATDATGPSVESTAIPFYPEWPPLPNRVTRLGSGTGERGTFGPACAWRMSLHERFPRYPWRFKDGSPVRIIGDAIWWSLLKQHGKTLKRVPAVLGRYHSHPEGQAEFRNPAGSEHEKLSAIGLALL